MTDTETSESLTASGFPIPSLSDFGSFADPMETLKCSQEHDYIGNMVEARVRPVAGFDGYFVTDDGRVFRELSLSPQRRTGHLTVVFNVDGRQYRRSVHRLVLQAFVGPCPGGMECLHGDGNPRNNRLPNLRWGTRRENRVDMIRHGRSGRKLSDEQVAWIRWLHARGASLTGIAAKYGVSVSTVHDIVRWKKRTVSSKGETIRKSERDR